MTSATHRVERQIVEVVVSDPARAHRVQEQVRGLQEEVERLLEELFDELLGGSARSGAGSPLFRIDRLEIELGTFASADLATELPARLADVLPPALVEAIKRSAGATGTVPLVPIADGADEGWGSGPESRPLALDDNAAGSAWPDQAPVGDRGVEGVRSAELVAWFLANGMLPWWADRSADAVADALRTLAAASPERLAAVLQAAVTDRASLRRLVRAAPDDVLVALLDRWAGLDGDRNPGNAPWRRPAGRDRARRQRLVEIAWADPGFAGAPVARGFGPAPDPVGAGNAGGQSDPTAPLGDRVGHRGGADRAGRSDRTEEEADTGQRPAIRPNRTDDRKRLLQALLDLPVGGWADLNAVREALGPLGVTLPDGAEASLAALVVSAARVPRWPPELLDNVLALIDRSDGPGREPGPDLVSRDTDLSDQSDRVGTDPTGPVDRSDRAGIDPARPADRSGNDPAGAERAPAPEPFEPPVPNPAEPSPDADYVGNGGLVLLAPFLARLLDRLGLTEADRFISPAARHRAVALLHYAATADPHPPEHEVTLAKVLCGIKPTALFDPPHPPSQDEQDEVHLMLSAAIAHAPGLGPLDPDELRSVFLARPAVLRSEPGSWLLQVERRPDDDVLESLAWDRAWVALPWMSAPLRVEW